MPDREHELTLPEVALCGRWGWLNPAAVGWSRFPIHDCAIPAHWLRKKKWNYWCVIGPEALFSATICSLDYASLAFTYYLDFATSEFIEQTVTAPFGRGCLLGNRVEDRASFEDAAMTAHFEPSDEGVTLRVQSAMFGGKNLDATLTVHRPPDHESLNVVVPWSRRRFQFTSKHLGLPVSGTVKIGDRTFSFDAASAFACLDFGRGVWPYATFWNWGGGAAKQDSHVVAFNLGGKWTDGTGVTENGFFVDGRLSKVSDDLAWEYAPENYLKPWTIRTQKTNRIHLHFVPFYERIAKTRTGPICSSVHQLIGHYSGYLVADDGQTIHIDGLTGWAEEHEARW